MTEPDSGFAELFDAFVDGALQGEEKERVRLEIESSDYWSSQLKLQRRIDDAARSLFSPPADLDISRSLDGVLDVPSSPILTPANSTFWTRRNAVVMLTIAASVAWMAVALNLFSSRPEQPVFRPVELTKVYQTCVGEGFQPYWVCDDDEIFATTFERRQGVELNLAAMPAGREMVGLSYLAGISRRSTSMLATVDGQQVIVFVAALDDDWKPKTGFSDESNLYVHRLEKFGLVFYEVSPFDEMSVAPYFQRFRESR